MTDILNYMNNKSIKDYEKKELYNSKVKNLIENEDNILELEECNICMVRGVNPVLKCSTCNKCICTSCCNFIKSFKYDRELKNKDKCGVSALYDCPYCRCKTETAFSKLNKDDLLEFIKIDYIRFIVIGNKYDMLEERCEELLMKTMKIDHLKKKEDDNEVIDFLIEENNKLKSIAESIDFYIKNNNETVRQNKELTEELFDLKKKHKELIDNNRKIVEENKELTKYNDEIVKSNNYLYGLIQILGKGQEEVINTITNFINSSITPKKILMKIKKYITEELGTASFNTEIIQKGL